MTPLRIVHVADLHLGFTGPSSLIVTDGADAGRPLRETDIERAVRWLADALINATPTVHLLVIAGDLFHRANPMPRAVAAAAEFIGTLHAAGIEVVIIEGNHDAPVTPLHGSPLSYLETLGAHVAHGSEARTVGAQVWRTDILRDHVIVHAVPHGALKGGDLSSLHPVDGFVNLLVAHGRVQGETRVDDPRPVSSIPADLIRKDWTYIALGDAHAHNHVPLTSSDARYAGSLEALTFAEGQPHPFVHDDPYAHRGALDIRISKNGPAAITSFLYGDSRPLLRLSPISADGKAVSEVLALIDEATRDLPAEALVQLEIQHCPAVLYAQLNHQELQLLRQRARHIDLIWRLYDDEVLQNETAPAADSLPDQWTAYLAEHVEDDTERTWVQTEGMKRLLEARAALERAQDGS
ncbi:metallophosphoesterase family protein [Deinococcus marmoris]|uniref:DNA double-strand break repair protein Mre11 n=1 Tax=Deinococcus marmoris TaxID=249408 RepID=A0A1U7P220_9DEIO|nr:DNA repair exonuclease [Deinococcus marmoris]OLV19210.1 DNA double-strand break repair protein Mre11 [Deinococcus marmoris]